MHFFVVAVIVLCSLAVVIVAQDDFCSMSSMTFPHNTSHYAAQYSAVSDAHNSRIFIIAKMRQKGKVLSSREITVHVWHPDATDDNPAFVPITAASPLPAGPLHTPVVLVGDVLYVLDCWFADESNQTHESWSLLRFDVVEDEWLAAYLITPSTIAGQYPCMTTNASHIFIVSGERLYLFDIESNNSEAIDIVSANTYLTAASCLAINDELYLFGGIDAQTNRASDLVYKWTYIDHYSTASLLEATLPSARAHMATAYDDGSDMLYLVGGQDSTGAASGGVALFDIGSQSIMSEVRFKAMDDVWSSGCIVVNDSLFIFGGYSFTQDQSGSIYKCSIAGPLNEIRLAYDADAKKAIVIAFVILMIITIIVRIATLLYGARAAKVSDRTKAGVKQDGLCDDVRTEKVAAPSLVAVDSYSIDMTVTLAEHKSNNSVNSPQALHALSEDLEVDAVGGTAKP